jgi:hypothetical protein
MDQVIGFVQDLCHMDRYGGRCLRVDHGAWEIYDVASWTEEHAAALHKRFPSIAQSVVSCRKSLSGYCVILQLQQSSHAWTSLMVAGVMMAVMGAMVAAVK